MTNANLTRLSRRGFLGASAASLGAGVLPSGALAQGAKYRRWEISDPSMPPSVLVSYKKAISAMLNLPETDPRNWYRNAIIHAFDCPHGNWWFLPWHRAYLGWFERTCRELSGDPTFALPYWDWTKTQRIPAAMFNDVLDPNHSQFIAKFSTFKTKFQPAIAAQYAAFTAAQQNAMSIRGYLKTPAEFWDITEQFFFFDQPDARGRTAANPDFDDDTKLAVDIEKVRAALGAESFSGTPAAPDAPGFGSGKAANHFGDAEQGVLESEPHNNVHGALGTPTNPSRGFMVSHFSPTDPIFFLHHGNIDRLWDVWTRRQAGRGKPSLPEGADLATWSAEEFLFFSTEAGQPVTKIKCSEYTSMTVFDYDYSVGSGEDEALFVAALTAASAVAPQNFAANVTAASLGAGAVARSVVDVPANTLQALSFGGRRAVARITLNLSEADRGRRFRVVVTPPGGGAPIQAGTITPFGPHGHHAGPATFTVSLPRIPTPAAAAASGTSVPIEISVVPTGPASQVPVVTSGHTTQSQVARIRFSTH